MPFDSHTVDFLKYFSEQNRDRDVSSRKLLVPNTIQCLPVQMTCHLTVTSSPGAQHAYSGRKSEEKWHDVALGRKRKVLACKREQIMRGFFFWALFILPSTPLSYYRMTTTVVSPPHGQVMQVGGRMATWWWM